MRNVRIELLDADLRSAQVPITGMALGVSKVHDTATHSSFVPFDGELIRLDWAREPKPTNLKKAIDIIQAHSATGQLITLDSIQHRGSDYPRKVENRETAPIDEFTWSPIPIDAQKLTVAVEKALKQGVAPTPVLPGGQSNYFCPPDDRVQASKATIEELVSYLKSEPSLSFFDGGTLHSGPLGGHGVTMTALAHWLLSRSIVNSVPKAVLDLQQFVDAPGTPIAGVLAFCGVRVPAAMDLGNGFRVIPWSELPPCFAKHEIDARNSGEIPKHVPGQFHFKPTGAVCADYFYCPKMMLPNGTRFPSGTGKNVVECKNFFRIYRNLQSILDCMTLCGPCAPLPLLCFHTVPDWVPLGTPGGSGGYSGFIPEILFFRGYDHADLQVTELAELASCYLDLKPNVVERLRIPIDRLNFAMRRQRSVDKALELGIAFESLIMNDESVEITHKMSQRVAWLVGENVNKRLSIAACIKDLYELRSKAIHVGVVPDKTKKAKQHADYALDDAIELCAKVIRKVIGNGDFPEWDRLILGQAYEQTGVDAAGD